MVPDRLLWWFQTPVVPAVTQIPVTLVMVLDIDGGLRPNLNNSPRSAPAEYGH